MSHGRVSDSALEQLADQLKSTGIRVAFGVTGSGQSMQFIGLLEDRGIAYHAVTNEASGALMAGACCRDGRMAALSLSIKGPGFANMFAGILSNHYEGRPALSVSEAYTPEVTSGLMHKRLNHREVAGSVLRKYATLREIPDLVMRLRSSAEAEFPGPAHIDLTTAVVGNCAPTVVDSPEGSPVTDENLESELRKAERPALILGSLANRRFASIDWANLEIPVFTTASAKGAINEYHSHAGGVITGENGPVEREILSQADLVLGVGLRNNEVIKPKLYGKRLLLLDVIQRGFHEGFSSTLFNISEKSDLWLNETLHRGLEGKAWGAEEILAIRNKVCGGFREWSPPTIIEMLSRELPNTTVVPDTGYVCTYVETFWRTKQPSDFCGSSNGRYMGVSIPTAIGLALQDGSRPVICAFGDGGVGPHFAEISLAVKERLPILFWFVSDGRYGSVAYPAGTRAVQDAIVPPRGDWVKAATALGCNAGRAGTISELMELLNGWKQLGGPVFIQTSFPPAEYASHAGKLR